MRRIIGIWRVRLGCTGRAYGCERWMVLVFDFYTEGFHDRFV